MSKIKIRYSQDTYNMLHYTSKTQPRHSQDTANSQPNYIQDTVIIELRYNQNTVIQLRCSKIYQKQAETSQSSTVLNSGFNPLLLQLLLQLPLKILLGYPSNTSIATATLVLQLQH